MKRTLLAIALLPFLAAVAAAEGGRPGRVTMSDGTVAQGRLEFTPGVKVHITDPATGKGRDAEPADLAAILFRLDGESLERPYTFTTPGKDEKTYGEGRYPLRNLLATVVWRTGERAEGHVRTTVVRVVGPDKEGAEDPDERRFVLRRQWKGEVGQTLDDLVYAREVRFTDVPDPEAKPPGTLDVRLAGAGPARAAGAYGLASRLVYAGTVVDAAAGHVRFDALPADTYDVAVLAGDVALVGSARDTASARPIVDAEDAAALAEIVAKGDDLYDARALVATGGDRDAARLLVAKRVLRPTTFDAERGRTQALVAVDLWTAHRLEHEWRIDARASMLRVVLTDGAVPPRAVAEPRLAGIRLAPAQHAEVKMDRTEGTR